MICTSAHPPSRPFAPGWREDVIAQAEKRLARYRAEGTHVSAALRAECLNTGEWWWAVYPNEQEQTATGNTRCGDTARKLAETVAEADYVERRTKHG